MLSLIVGAGAVVAGRARTTLSVKKIVNASVFMVGKRIMEREVLRQLFIELFVFPMLGPGNRGLQGVEGGLKAEENRRIEIPSSSRLIFFRHSR